MVITAGLGFLHSIFCYFRWPLMLTLSKYMGAFCYLLSPDDFPSYLKAA